MTCLLLALPRNHCCPVTPVLHPHLSLLHSERAENQVNLVGAYSANVYVFCHRTTHKNEEAEKRIHHISTRIQSNMIAWFTKTQEYHNEFGPGGCPVTVGGGGTFISLFAAGAPKSLIV